MTSRPPGARAGGPPPWAGMPEAERRGITLARVRGALDRVARAEEGGGAPGDPEASGLLLATGAPSAVLVALFEEGGEARVVLTRRAAHLRTHRGEVSFPGGRIEHGEAHVAAALREAAEEVGLDPTGVEVVGALGPLPTFSSASWITPVVGVLPARPHLVENPAEVEQAFDVALADLVADGVFHEEIWSGDGTRARPLGDGEFPVWFFELAEDTVWGATARILVELICLALGVGR